MLVSIIIPARNEAQAIPGLLHDLVPLRAAGHEVLVVDGGSRDGTACAAQPLVDRVLDAPTGRAAQMNAGAAVATGDVLWFLHADSRLHPDALQALLLAIDAGRPWGRFDVRLSGASMQFRVIESMMNLRSCLTGIATGDQGVFVDRQLFERVGGFPNLPLMEDIALSRALRRLTRPACIRAPRLQTSSRRWEQHGTVRTVLLMWRLRLAYARGADPATLARQYR